MRRLHPLRSRILATLVPVCCSAAMAWSQQPGPAPTAANTLPMPRPVAGNSDDARLKFAGPTAEEFLKTLRVPINLPTVLRLALSNNLEIAQAREAVTRARAALLRAQVAILPDLTIGADYTNHQGQIQKTEGNIETIDRDALFVGGGPVASFQFVDAIYGPGIARQALRASQAGFQRVNNDTLRSVGDAYFNVLRARRRLARIIEVLRLLTDQRIVIEGEAYKGLLPLMEVFVQTGARAALRSELYRVEVEVLRRREELRGAMQEYQVDVAELARLLRLDPQTPLLPAEDFRVPMPMPCAALADEPTAELVRVALNNRPEMAENQALVAAAMQRVKVAKVRPFLPTATTTLAWGGFGGGPALNPPYTKIVNGKATTVTSAGYGESGIIGNFNTRMDFEGILQWRVHNLGFGDRADRLATEAAFRQANWRLLATQDRVAAQVVEAQENIEAWRDRLAIVRAGLFNAAGQPAGPVFTSMRLNLERISNNAARPLEALDAIRSLSDQLDAYGQAVTDYERSEFRLLLALGMPPPALLNCVTPPGASATPPVQQPIATLGIPPEAN